MTQRIGCLNGNNITFDSDITMANLAIIKPGIISGLEVTNSGINPGKALIKVTRAGGQEILVNYENTEKIASINTTGTKKIFIEIDQNKINSGDKNTEDGSGIAEIKTADNYPENNFIPLANINNSVIIDERELIQIQDRFELTKMGNSFNTADKLVKLEENGKLPVVDGSNLTGIITEVNGTTLNGTFGETTTKGDPIRKGLNINTNIAILTNSNYANSIGISMSMGVKLAAAANSINYIEFESTQTISATTKCKILSESLEELYQSSSMSNSGARAIYYFTDVKLKKGEKYYFVVEKISGSLSLKSSKQKSYNNEFGIIQFISSDSKYIVEDTYLAHKVQFKTIYSEDTNKFYKAKTNSEENKIIGFASNNYNSDNEGKIVGNGYITGLSGLNQGKTYYLGEEGGLTSDTSINPKIPLGTAVSSDILKIT